ncbi:MAG: hypothetical protein K6G46_10445 [Prevotella sp.]|nr:hypothetical protein [Prevotella sp.]
MIWLLLILVILYGLFYLAKQVIVGTGVAIGAIARFVFRFIPLVILCIYACVVMEYWEFSNKYIWFVVSFVLAFVMYLSMSGAAFGLAGAVAFTIINIVPFFQRPIPGIVVAIIVIWFLRAFFDGIAHRADEEIVAFGIFDDNKFVDFISATVSLVVLIIGLGFVLFD